jgi:hypothetical protein
MAIVIRSRRIRHGPRSSRPWQLFRPFLEGLESCHLPSGRGCRHLVTPVGLRAAPLSFEVKQSQTAPQVNFLSQGSGYALSPTVPGPS